MAGSEDRSLFMFEAARLGKGWAGVEAGGVGNGRVRRETMKEMFFLP